MEPNGIKSSKLFSSLSQWKWSCYDKWNRNQPKGLEYSSKQAKTFSPAILLAPWSREWLAIHLAINFSNFLCRRAGSCLSNGSCRNTRKIPTNTNWKILWRSSRNNPKNLEFMVGLAFFRAIYYWLYKFLQLAAATKK